MLTENNKHPDKWGRAGLVKYLLNILPRSVILKMTKQEMIDAVLKDEIDKE